MEGADLRGVSTEEGVPEMDQGEGEVLEEEETQELAHPDVRPSSVHQQEALQVTELAEGVVAGHGSLHALLATDPHANVCSWKGRRPTDQNITITITRPSIHAPAPWWPAREPSAAPVLTFDHVDVVGSISDGQRDGLLVLLHQAHHVGLLLRCDAAADDSLALARHVDKVHLRRHPMGVNLNTPPAR